MSRALLSALALALILTLTLETAFFFAAGKRGKGDWLLLLLVNLMTNPAVVLLYWLAAVYLGRAGWPVKIPLEIWAVATEGYYYKKYGSNYPRPYAFAAAANLFSFGIGILLQNLFS